MTNDSNSYQLYIFFNSLCVAAALGLLCLSLWLAPVDLSTKGYWGMGVLWLCGSIANLVKYRFDQRLASDVTAQVQKARTEKLVSEYGSQI
jgi:hypothetical protein